MGSDVVVGAIVDKRNAARVEEPKPEPLTDEQIAENKQRLLDAVIPKQPRKADL